MDDSQFVGTDNPRERRVLSALLEGPKTREEIDHITQASNGPDVIYRLRAKGLSIVTDLRPCVTVDGELSRYGLYRLPPEGRRTVREWMRGAAGTTPNGERKAQQTDTLKGSTKAPEALP